MDIINVFAIISGIIFLGYASEYIFKKTKIPDVIFLILTGIVIRTVLEWVHPDALNGTSEIFTTFALVFLLFQGALSIDFKTLLDVFGSAIKLTVLNFILTTIIVATIGYFLFDSVMIALLGGIILSGTSSAVVIPLVNSISIRDKFGLILTLESAITDVLCIIGVVTIIEIFETGNIAANLIFKNILSSFALAIVIGLILGFIWISVLSKNQILINAHILTIGIVVGLYAFVESSFVGASGAIAALSFGIVLGNSNTILMMINRKNDAKLEKQAARFRNKEKKHEILDMRVNKHVLSSNALNFYSEISFFLKIFFFVYLGILIDFSNPIMFVYGFFITIAIYLIRPFSVKAVFRKERNFEKDRVFLESLIPKGLAAAVLTQLAVQKGILGEVSGIFTNIMLSVVLISILLTAVCIFLIEREKFSGFFNGYLYSKKE